MIKLTHLNGGEFVLNAELIKYIEETPDTVVTLMGDEKILVRESADEVIKLVIEYGRLIRALSGIL